MEIFVYSDESGVFDKVHNELFVFGGLIFLGKNNKDIASRKYIKAEGVIRDKHQYKKDKELKACLINKSDKLKLFRSLNNCFKFGTVIYQNEVMDQVFADKKDKQRYLDYAYKIAVKRALESLIELSVFNPADISAIHFYTDEHSTATNGRYELREALYGELIKGTFNYNYHCYYAPILSPSTHLDLHYCDSKRITLVRAADIVANRLLFLSTKDDWVKMRAIKNFHIITLPNEDKNHALYSDLI